MVGAIIQFLQSREYLLTVNCMAFSLSTSAEYGTYNIDYNVSNTLSHFVSPSQWYSLFQDIVHLGNFEHVEILKHVLPRWLPPTWHLKIS